MKGSWKIFADESAANAYAEAEAIKYLPRHMRDVTKRMADPMTLADGRWVVQTVDGSGTVWQADWVLADPDAGGVA